MPMSAAGVLGEVGGKQGPCEAESAAGSAANYTEAVHELSIAHSLVGLVQEHLPPDAGRVTAVELRIGALAGVVRGALEFCYDIAVEGTLLQGSALRIQELPVVIHCPACAADREIEGPISFRCPQCGTPSGDIRQGRELDLGAIEYDSVEEAGA